MEEEGIDLSSHLLEEIASEDEGEEFINPTLLHDGSEFVHYKVKSGDTLENLAEQLAIDWEEIALLNWETTDKTKIQFYLENYFVCEKKENGELVFSDDDDPGILFLPFPTTKPHGRPRIKIRASRFPDEE